MDYSTSVAGLCQPGENVPECLLRTETGFCQHFASTMVMVLRELEIPARLVSGYLPGTARCRRPLRRPAAGAACLGGGLLPRRRLGALRPHARRPAAPLRAAPDRPRGGRAGRLTGSCRQRPTGRRRPRRPTPCRSPAHRRRLASPALPGSGGADAGSTLLLALGMAGARPARPDGPPARAPAASPGGRRRPRLRAHRGPRHAPRATDRTPPRPSSSTPPACPTPCRRSAQELYLVAHARVEKRYGLRDVAGERRASPAPRLCAHQDGPAAPGLEADATSSPVRRCRPATADRDTRSRRPGRDGQRRPSAVMCSSRLWARSRGTPALVSRTLIDGEGEGERPEVLESDAQQAQRQAAQDAVVGDHDAPGRAGVRWPWAVS